MSSHKPVSSVKLENEGGILPFNVLLENDKRFNLVNCEMEDGILPVSSLLSKIKSVSCVKSPISLGILGPLTLLPSFTLSNLSVVRQSANDECPINSHAIFSGVTNKVGEPAGLSVTGEEVGVVVEGDSVGGDVSPVGRGRATNTTTNTIPTTRRRANKQPPTKIPRFIGRSCHFFGSGELGA